MKSGRWTSDEVHQLMDLRFAGRSWDDIGAEMNRKPMACQWRHNYELSKRGAERARRFVALAEVSRKYEAASLARRNSAIPASPLPPPTPPLSTGTDAGRSFLVRGNADIDEIVQRGATAVLPPPAAEKRCVRSFLVRGSIDIHDVAERGATAVVCGDPPPGRSALDERRRM